MKVLGVDPGKKGALVIIDTNTNQCISLPIPIVDDRIDVRTIGKFIFEHKPDIAFVEKVHGMPKHSSKGNFTFGVNYGLLMACIYFLEVPVELVSPRTWQKEILGERTGTNTKDDSIQYTLSHYPTVNLKPGRCRVEHDGIADAVCIAEYGIRKSNVKSSS